jgi:hypothetical protein
VLCGLEQLSELDDVPQGLSGRPTPPTALRGALAGIVTRRGNGGG